MVRSINEPGTPAGDQQSDGTIKLKDPASTPPAAPPPDPLPSTAELQAMTRAQLDALASERGFDSSACANKAEVIALLQETP